MKSEGSSYEYDVFVSYRQRDPDMEWVRRVLVPALDRAKLKVFVDYRSFRLGDAIITSMARAVDVSRFTVIVMSPSYFESNFTELERIMAQHLGLEQSQRWLIGLTLTKCDLPTELRPFLWLDVSTVKDPTSPVLEALVTALRSDPEDQA